MVAIFEIFSLARFLFSGKGKMWVSLYWVEDNFDAISDDMVTCTGPCLLTTTRTHQGRVKRLHLSLVMMVF